LQSKILPERYVIIDSVDDSGYIYPYDSILLDESNHSMYYIQNNQFFLKRLDTYYSKANKLMVPNAADLVGMYSREPKSPGIPGEARALLPIFPPYDSTNITTGNFPLTFTDTRMLYISYFQTMHHANTVFIMTDTSLNEVFRTELQQMDAESRELLEKIVGYMEKKYISGPMKKAKEILLSNVQKHEN
jgi:hypothetical protein